MPKKVQFTREKIVQVAIDIIREEGASALSSRSIGKSLGCSVSPIFREYSNMEELMGDVRKEAEKIFLSYVSDVCSYYPAFKEFGMRLIRFSKEEPDLFYFIFLDIGGRNSAADGVVMECLKQTEMTFGITSVETEYVYSQIWPFVLGLAQLCNRNPETYTDEYVSGLLSTQFTALITLIKSGCQVSNIEPHLIPEGERVYLRRWRESDAPSLYILASDPDLGPRAGWPPHKSEEDSLDVIRRFFSNDTTWAVILKETGEIVGCAGYHTSADANISIEDSEAEVGYWISKAYWNQGLCTEALGLVVEHCKSLGKYRALFGEHFTDNPASGRVMEKCGFTYTGEVKTCPALLVGAEKEVRVLKMVIRQ